MDTIKVAVINHSTLDDSDVLEGLEALQIQVDEDFGPAWNVEARLQLLDRERPPGPYSDHWGLLLLDSFARHRDTGYHHLTPAGRPLAKVFIGELDDEHWTLTVSHELLEMLANPWLNRAVIDNRGQGETSLLAQEVCDPCGPNGYDILGHEVSNFVHPGWFQPPGVAGMLDSQGRIETPFGLLVHGYIPIYEDPATGWRFRVRTGPGQDQVGVYQELPDRNGRGGGIDGHPEPVGNRTQKRLIPLGQLDKLPGWPWCC